MLTLKQERIDMILKCLKNISSEVDMWAQELPVVAICEIEDNISTIQHELIQAKDDEKNV